VSPTVQGVCADCWGSKGGRQFWIRKTGPSADDPVIDWLSGYALVAVLALLPILVLVLIWILG
jgi:hypothetical protein